MDDPLEKLGELNRALHRTLLDTGLVTVDQWNADIAPHMCATRLSIEVLEKERDSLQRCANERSKRLRG